MNKHEMQEQLNLFPDEKKLILDCTCGGRSIWFGKKNRLTVYTDKRCEEHHGTFGTHQSNHSFYVNPDIICDFTALPFPDNSFRLVVFDPPHIEGLAESSWIRKRYGTLGADWREVIGRGFRECMRVLEPYGILVFKWSEIQIPSEEVWKCFGEYPLFGHHSGKKMNTFWAVFMKGNRADV